MRIKRSQLLILFLGIIISLSCTNDSTSLEPWEFLTSSGNTIELEGLWVSGCISDNDDHLEEAFGFYRNEFTISILIYEDSECSTLIATKEVEVEFNVDGKTEAELNGSTVIANRISGIQTVFSSGEILPFKQVIYIDDGGSFFYHARFGSDGGRIDEDGYPVELIPIKLSKQN